MTVDPPASTIDSVICAYCSAALEDNQLQCPSCRAAVRRACPKCGKLLEYHLEQCPHCSARMPLPPEPDEPAPPPATVRSSVTSIILNVLGTILLILAAASLIERNVQGSVICFAFAVLFFAVARIKDLAESTWARLGRIEDLLEKRSRRR